MISLSDKIVKILRNGFAAGLLMGSFSVSAQNELLYWQEDSHTRWDPSPQGVLKSWVPAGASFEILTCEESGWCFGLVYGHQEGWVLRSELGPIPPPRSTEATFLSSDEKNERTYHLQNKRDFYFVLGNDLNLGVSSYQNKDEVVLSSVKAWALSFGYGGHIKYFSESRWDWEWRLGHLSEQRYSESEDVKFNSNGFFTAGETKWIRPDNETFGYGGFAHVRWQFSNHGGPFLVAAGVLITHGWSAPHPQWFAWKFFAALVSKESYLGMGLDLHF
jgi:hypothetical protein